MPYATIQCSKTNVTHKYNHRIDWKLRNKLILSISTELCYKISMLGSWNGPSTFKWEIPQSTSRTNGPNSNSWILCWHNLYLKQYSAISGQLKYPFSLTPIAIDRYSLGKLMFKISVGYEFTLARYFTLVRYAE